MDKKQILIVDDELDVLSVLEKGLTSEGYSVITASCGKNVMSLTKTRQPDLIVLDLELPDMYGGDIARMLEEDPETKHIPVMFLTGMFPKKMGSRVIANHVLFEKPYDILKLVTAIEELMSEKVFCR